MCPGLAMGIRASEIALREIGPHAADEGVVAVVETDMCAVDAIQYMPGCTFGKGNLIHLDHGKNAYTFFRRSDGNGIRVATRAGALLRDPEHSALITKTREGTATDEERRRFQELHRERSLAILQEPEEDLYEVREVTGVEVPPRAFIHAPKARKAMSDPSGAPNALGASNGGHQVITGVGERDASAALGEERCRP